MKDKQCNNKTRMDKNWKKRERDKNFDGTWGQTGSRFSLHVCFRQAVSISCCVYFCLNQVLSEYCFMLIECI